MKMLLNQKWRMFFWAMFFLTALGQASLECLVSDARELTGKVMALYHEPVVINTKTMDKVSVTVAACPSNRFETVSYPPGNLSDDNSLGSLYTHLANSTRLSSQKTQYVTSVGGHVTLVVNDTNNTIQKTTLWGYNWECGQNVDGGGYRR